MGSNDWSSHETIPEGQELNTSIGVISSDEGDDRSRLGIKVIEHSDRGGLQRADMKGEGGVSVPDVGVGVDPAGASADGGGVQELDRAGVAGLPGDDQWLLGISLRGMEETEGGERRARADV